ncbi:MAG TPA: ATPase [Bacteroidales bacterium]|nr:ATPase [Bacteroidales bacterium]
MSEFFVMNLLLADSGSTKTEWKVIQNGIPLESLFSQGINPYFLETKQIISILKKEIQTIKNYEFDFVYFYGSGCNSESKNDVVERAISAFIKTKGIFIGSDLLGAARGLCQNEPGIACIMGTGSNSCYYDGIKIVSNVPPLGYILGDEGSAAVMGRKLLSAVLKKQVSTDIINRFNETYKLTRAEILENVYTKPLPNKFLGSFAKFISSNIEMPELQNIVTSSFDEFIIRNILQYPESYNLPVHFTGSVAFYFKTFLIELLLMHHLKPGKILLSPMEGLLKYHIENTQ